MPGLLHLTSDVADDADADAFATWCDQHHVEVLRVPGFRTARRYELIGGRPGRDLLTTYDLDDLSVLAGADYERHGREQTPLPPDLGAALTFGRSLWERVGGDDAGAAPHLVRYEGSGDGRRFVGDEGELTLLETDDPDATLAALPSGAASAWRLLFAAP